MEVYFLDVAQGTCQIILLGNRTAIVIDAGSRNDQIPLQFLKQFHVERIAALLITHSHADHIGGATAILGDYQGMIDLIGFVDDGQFRQSEFWSRVKFLLDNQSLAEDQLFRMEVKNVPEKIWENAVSPGVLRVFSPTAYQNLIAQDQHNQNATSAVLILDVNDKRIVFAADSTIDQWRSIESKHGKINCDVLGVPHHGGRIHQNVNEIQWLYEQAIQCAVAVVSVGTTNQHKHPLPEVLVEITRSGGRVLCTQMTLQCCGNLESIRPGLAQTGLLGRSNPKKELTGLRKNSRNVACAGTTRIAIKDGILSVDRIASHQQGVDRLLENGFDPICRR